MEKHGLKDQAIHWHFCSGDKDLATQLCKHFDKLKLSINSLFLSKSEIHKAVAVIPLECLMLETNSLHLDPDDIGYKQRSEV